MSIFRHRPLPIRCPSSPSPRAFSTTPRTSSLQLDKNDQEVLSDTVPAYPYGPARWYKQSNLGLYGNTRIQFGNNVSDKFETKTRRTWHPNIFRKRLYSNALNRFVQVRVSSRVLRTIDKLGGLDEYLLGEKEGRVKELGMSGWWLRWAIMQTPGVRRRFRSEREQFGVPAEGLEDAVDELEGEEQLDVQDHGAIPASALESAGEEESSLLEDEAVTTDDAFTIEQPLSLPPLKFRVGPAQHLVLTPEGWRRTKPDFRNNMKKVILERNDFLREYVDRKMEKFDAELNDVVKAYSNRSAEAIAKEATTIMDRIQGKEQEERSGAEVVSVDDPVSAQIDVTGDVHRSSDDANAPMVQDATTLHDTATSEVEASTEEEDAERHLTSRSQPKLGKIRLTDEETRQLRKDVRKQFRIEAEGMLEKKVDEVEKRIVEGQRRRNKLGRQRKVDRAWSEREKEGMKRPKKNKLKIVSD